MMRTAPAGSGPVNEPRGVRAACLVSRLICLANMSRKAPHMAKTSPISVCTGEGYSQA